jgi:hypothetical protein
MHSRSACALEAAGWSADDIVVLSQLVAFLSFQIRVVAGLGVLSAHWDTTAAATARTGASQPVAPVHEEVVPGTGPVVFTQAELDWQPWLAPLEEAALTHRHYDGLVDAVRAKSPYFRLLARDPDTWERAPAPTRTSSTTPKPACHGPSGSWLRRPRRATTAASIALRCMPGSPAISPAAARMCSACWMKACTPIWGRAGMPSWTPVWR